MLSVREGSRGRKVTVRQNFKTKPALQHHHISASDWLSHLSSVLDHAHLLLVNLTLLRAGLGLGGTVPSVFLTQGNQHSPDNAQMPFPAMSPDVIPLLWGEAVRIYRYRHTGIMPAGIRATKRLLSVFTFLV